MYPDDTLAAQRRLVDTLRDPTHYPHAVGRVTVVETHISFVLLTGDYAYKIKKAVDLGFVDYTRRERRRFFCHEEMRLNRRLAPQLYLDVVAFGGTPAAPCWQGGEQFEYAVRMRQFDPESRLDRLLARGELSSAHVDALAATVAAFHAAVPAVAAGEHGTPAAVWAPVVDNFSGLRQLAPAGLPASLADLAAWSRAEYARLEELLAARRAAGRVRECHGDLHLGNVALIDGRPTVFDGIEFSPELRWIDVVNDLAFLAMDLAERGRPDHAWRLLNRWLEETGDYGALAALRFYQVYRALVRAKVASIRAAGDLPAADRRAAADDAARYLAHAAATAVPGAGAVVVTHGLAGAGKTTLARRLAAALGAVHLRSDNERKRLHGLQPLAASGAGMAAGIYAADATAATYERLAELAAQVVAAGYPAVIDAACLRRWQRDRLRDCAQRLGVPFLLLDCQAPLALLEARVAARAERRDDASEAGPAVLAAQLAAAEPLAPQEREAALAVDTAADTAGILEAVRRRLRSRSVP